MSVRPSAARRVSAEIADLPSNAATTEYMNRSGRTEETAGILAFASSLEGSDSTPRVLEAVTLGNDFAVAFMRSPGGPFWTERLTLVSRYGEVLLDTNLDVASIESGESYRRRAAALRD